MRYVPISDELKLIAERLGEYLHCVGAIKLQRPAFWTEFKKLTDRGIVLLADAVSGELLAPPMWQTKSKSVEFAFDQAKKPKFLTNADIGTSLKFDVTLVVVSKTSKMVTLRNTDRNVGRASR